MEYEKYLKYKTKYLELKEKFLQLGGAIYICIENIFLLAKPEDSENFTKDTYGKNIVLLKGEEVDIDEMREDKATGSWFGKVVKNSVSGWVNMKNLERKKEGTGVFAKYLEDRVFRLQQRNSKTVKAINEVKQGISIMSPIKISCSFKKKNKDDPEETYLKIHPKNSDNTGKKDKFTLLREGEILELTLICKDVTTNMLFGNVTKKDVYVSGWVNLENLWTFNDSDQLVKLTELDGVIPDVLDIPPPGGRAVAHIGPGGRAVAHEGPGGRAVAHEGPAVEVEKCFHDRKKYGGSDFTLLRNNFNSDDIVKDKLGNDVRLNLDEEVTVLEKVFHSHYTYTKVLKQNGQTGWVKNNYLYKINGWTKGKVPC